MPDDAARVEAAYRQLVRAYLLHDAGEAALLQALEAGRAALAAGLSVLDVARLHRLAMQDEVLATLVSPTAMELLVRGEDVLAQSLVPYEMTHRGFVDANARLQALNEELEQRVQERTEQLTRANQELEAFSYTVSHDLRAPLRAMDGFSRILLEEYASELSPGAVRYLQRVRSNALRMSQLVDDLLAFSRLGRQPLQVRAVNPATIVGEVLEDLRAEVADRRIAVTIEDLPVCQADPALLKQVYANLIGNAVKYTRGQEAAAITVGYRTMLGDTVEGPIYFVRDNGVGFDMAYASKLFGVFQRLHSAEQFEGTGVGLAIVQRIIHRHGGQIWAESAPGAGATFFFTLPGTVKGGA